MYGKDGTITPEGAKAALAAGGTVLHGGTLYSKAETLPEEFTPLSSNPATAGATAQQVVGNEEESGKSDKPLDSLTKAELVELGAKHGVTLDPADKKDDLVSALEQAGVKA